ncbi:DUF4153 domain-containing protein [Nocardia asteroides]|uniref:DUF4153 domain-containing protein n=1 Tax=Nocardia asteroides TaxID=1824 RepID=UPI001E531C98|nr:DUF4173 domain-containing protein [Nocardia asteroides]UGT62394.1 DUF4173 domain-containing protein [Nocardia asteroides]
MPGTPADNPSETAEPAGSGATPHHAGPTAEATDALPAPPPAGPTAPTAVLAPKLASPSHSPRTPPLPPPRPPRRHRVSYPAGVLTAATAAGLAGALTVTLDRPGIGWLLAGTAAVTAVGTVHLRALRAVPNDDPTPALRSQRLGWTIATLALLAVGTVRAAPWLFVLCAIAAGITASLAVLGRRTFHGILFDALAIPLAATDAFGWAWAANDRRRKDGTATGNRRLAVSLAATAAVLLVFVPLLAGADATFAAGIDSITPRVGGYTILTWIIVFGTVVIGVTSALYLLAGPLGAAAAEPPRRTFALLEWALPVGTLTALFAAFVGTQSVAAFGGDDYVQRTADLTYAEYARSGFWQLSAVTVLTLAVVLPVLHRAAKDTATERRWLRTLLIAVSGLTLVIDASAVTRLWTYQEAYGHTVLRLLVGTTELGLAAVYLMVIAAVLRLRWAWLPRAAIGTAVATLLALAAIDPERLIADRNIDRWQHSGKLDTGYLGGLSADVAPALDRLPADLRLRLRADLADRLGDDTWQSWNLARHNAR